MKIDLEDKVQRFLVQEYVNKICHSFGKEDLYYNTHKLIHTFEVVQMAEELIKETKPGLSKQTQKQIIDAAILHDVGRCYEYEKGKRINIDHGKVGKDLILKQFPKMTIEAESTLLHNKLPAKSDPEFCFPVLDYVRDADMLANLEYNVEHSDIFLEHILPKKIIKSKTMTIDQEIQKAVRECRGVDVAKIKQKTLLTLFLWQLCWIYNLQTLPGKRIAKKRKLFIRYKNMVCEKIIPLLIVGKEKQEACKKQLNTLFPDKILI